MTSRAHTRPAAEEAPPREAMRAAALADAGHLVRWSRWKDESGEEFEARVTAEIERLGLDRVRFLA